MCHNGYDDDVRITFTMVVVSGFADKLVTDVTDVISYYVCCIVLFI